VVENSIFYTLGVFLITGSLLAIAAKESVYNLFGFLIAMIALAGLFGLLDNSFLFLAQIMISVGAVSVLGLIVMMTVNLKFENQPYEPNRVRLVFLALILEIPLGLLLAKALFSLDMQITPLLDGYGGLKDLGKTLYAEWIVPFEIVSILLLVSMIASIVIARKEKYFGDDHYYDHYKPSDIEVKTPELPKKEGE